MNYHHQSIRESFELTGSSKKGLSSAEAENRLQQYGSNTLLETKRKSPWLILFNQFKDFMVLILMAAAVISGIVGDLTDTVIIVIIVILNAIIGFSQEYRAEEAMHLLKKMAALQAIVLRDGIAVSVPAANLVPGDVVQLETGNAVPADLRFIETHSIRIDESALTGESVAVEKISEQLKDDNLPLGDRINMAYKGTIVNNGRANALVVATGMNTEIGKIARLLQEKESATPLQIRMADYGRKLSLIVLGICIILFVMGLLRGEEVMDMLLLSISLAVAAIPEALPALITIALAMGAKRLVKQNALIRKLTAVETLGSVSYICSDKTGTLTLNKMKVVKIQEEEANIETLPYPPLHLAMVLNHDVSQNENAATDNIHIGDPTEIALVESANEKLGKKTYDEIVALLPRVAELPFDTDRKCMTSIHSWKGKFLLFSKGATESISENLLSSENKTKMHQESIDLAKEGLRVLAFAYKILDAIPKPFTYENVEKDLKYAGLVGMIDPPREEAKKAIAECKSAGIQPVMITGDHPATAEAIAIEIGILEKNGLVVTGKVLQSMTAKELIEKVEKIRVYARVSPEQKINIVKALQAKGHYVSMTGDGVNDAPALRAANIGIAMGINGTDVSKEAAHMILLDDNFATIVKAVKEGRRIYDNIRKFVKYIMTCNGAEILTIFLAPLLGLPIPLLPIQILWINLVTDGLPGLALAKEQAEADIMKNPPRKSNESLFSGGIAIHILWVGLLMAGVTLGVQAWAIQQENTHWQTMVFTVLSLSQLGHILAIKSEKTFFYQQGFLSNKPLFAAVLFTAMLQVSIIYIPFANEVFKTQPLDLREMLICLGLSAVVFHAVELEKWIKKRFFS